MKHAIELHPFQVPNFVRQVMPPRPKQEGLSELPAIPLADLSADTLEALCAEFRRAVFQKAGKTPNAQVQPPSVPGDDDGK